MTPANLASAARSTLALPAPATKGPPSAAKEIDVNVQAVNSTPAGTFTVSNAGTAFDEIRVQAWFDSYVRTPFENQYGAVEIDNITAFTTAVPEPSSIAALSVLGLVGAVVGLRRRKK